MNWTELSRLIDDIRILRCLAGPRKRKIRSPYGYRDVRTGKFVTTPRKKAA